MAAVVTVNIWRTTKGTKFVPPVTQDLAVSGIDVQDQPIKVTANFWQSEFENPYQRVRHCKIQQTDLPDGEPYQIIADIPVEVVRLNDLQHTATFKEGNLSIGGISYRDAFQALIFEILDVFDRFSADSDILGPEPERQLAVLNKYIVKANG